MLKASLFIGLGGFLGSISRYLLSQYVDKKIKSIFPFGTFSVNIIGCLILGALYAFAEKENVMTSELRLLLTVGFCGSFTTFSTFAYEKVELINQGEWVTLALYAFASIAFGLVATIGGAALVKIL